MERRKHSISRELSFDGMKPSRTTQRYIERQVEKWIDQEAGASKGDNFGYRVEMQCEEWRHYFHCSLHVHSGDHAWHSEDSGKTLNEVISHAIRHLKPVVKEEKASAQAQLAS